MNRFFAFWLVIGLCASVSFAQNLPSKSTVPTLMVDSNKAPMKMDFKIPLVGISDPGMQFAHFSSRPLVLFYFAPKSPQSQQNYPVVQRLIKEFAPMGLTGLAISVGGVTKNDIRSFIEQHSASIPFFQDATRRFSDAYGNGYTPVLYLVNENGTIIRYTDGGDAAMKQLRDDLQKKFPKKKQK